jgi:hypothetical protein
MYCGFDFFGGGLPVSLLFSENFLYIQPMLIPIRYPGSRHCSTPGYTQHQAMVWMHGSEDLISVTNFDPCLGGGLLVSLLFSRNSFRIDSKVVSMVLGGTVSVGLSYYDL